MRRIEFPPGMTADNLKFDNLIATMSGDYAYIAAGMLSKSDLAGLTSVLKWEMALKLAFDPLGELAEEPAQVESKTEGMKTRKFLVAGKRDNELELRIVGVSQTQKKYLESPAFNEATVTIVLQNRDKDKITIFNGMKWAMEWSAATDGLYDVTISTDFTGSTDARVIALEGLPVRGFDFVNGLDVFTARGSEPSQEQELPLRVASGFVPVTATPPLGWIASGEEDGILTSEPVTLQPGRTAPLRLQYVGKDSGQKQAVMKFSAAGMERQSLNLKAYRGDGQNINSPIPVGSAAELAAIADGLDLHYVQVRDIDLKEEPFTSIGDNEAPFTGSFDGGGHTIYGLYARALLGDPSGLFGRAEGATVRGVRLRGAQAFALGDSGLLAGLVIGGVVENCEVEGKLSFRGDKDGVIVTACGGLAGRITGHATLGNCHVMVDVFPGQGVHPDMHEIGGFAGTLVSGTVERCSARGMLRGPALTAGGFVGACAGMIEDCYARVNVAAETRGLTGRSGGFAGEVTGTIERCWSLGRMSNYGSVGGFAGAALSNASFSSCAWCKEASLVSEKPEVAVALSVSEMYDQGVWEDLGYDFEEVWEMPAGGVAFPEIRRDYAG